jgi:hypothetical protein
MLEARHEGLWDVARAPQSSSVLADDGVRATPASGPLYVAGSVPIGRILPTCVAHDWLPGAPIRRC